MPLALRPSDRISHGCRLRYGCSASTADRESGILSLDLPVLAGANEDVILPDAKRVERLEGFSVAHTDNALAGFWQASADDEFEPAVRAAYTRLLHLTTGRHLYRIWNYVPRINETERGLENYRRFCRARSLAFEEHFGAGFRRHLPAASAVGTTRGPVAFAFLAGNDLPQHFENPAQVPAFDYPAQYGPRPPSFARATGVTRSHGRQVFISGTAAIRDHRTVCLGDLEGQLDCTMENLRLVGKAADAREAFQPGTAWARSFRVYLRYPDDLDRAQLRLERELFQPQDNIQYLRADICRTELLVEIEAVLTLA